MWLARLGGFLVGVGVFLALRGWYRTWPAHQSAFLWFLLLAVVAGFAGTIARRRSIGPPPLAAWLGWVARSGLVLGAAGWFLVLITGVRHDSVYARTDLERIAYGQREFQRDSGRTARSLEELDRRYRPYRSFIGGESLTMRVTSDGWTAEVRPTRTLQTCAIYEGSAALAPATVPGVAACTSEPHSSAFWTGWLLVAVGVLAGAGSIAIARRAGGT